MNFHREPKLIAATLDEYPAIQNMARFYVYDLSRECGINSPGWAIPTDGLYESFDFKEYFESDKRKAYLIMINNEYAGFVLLNQEGLFAETDWNIGEFFILGRFQGRGIGQKVLGMVLSQNPGRWEVSVIPENQSAMYFWKKAIEYYTCGNFQEKTMDVDYDPEQPKRIIFSFTFANDQCC